MDTNPVIPVIVELLESSLTMRELRARWFILEPWEQRQKDVITAKERMKIKLKNHE